MERVGIGFIGLSAAEFDAYTPREFQWRYEAELERENRHFERIAQLACWVINPWQGQHAQPLTVRKLLPRRPAKREPDWWDEE